MIRAPRFGSMRRSLEIVGERAENARMRLVAHSSRFCDSPRELGRALRRVSSINRIVASNSLTISKVRRIASGYVVSCSIGSYWLIRHRRSPPGFSEQAIVLRSTTQQSSHLNRVCAVTSGNVNLDFSSIARCSNICRKRAQTKHSCRRVGPPVERATELKSSIGAERGWLRILSSLSAW
jgi:hypothetical protein